ncbi:hydroxymethylglutaryl-CoA lyase YngG [Deltaproteobacteria bacterium]|nr:hydroxymethylglutaryl-CoA lyase YngG [Deltaproteobacteria bacterium]
MSTVSLYEVSPRDGLQNEAAVLPTEAKAELIGRLVGAGVKDIEVTSFVRPRWIPQLSDAAELVRMLPRVEGVRYWALVPNRVGLERAMESGIRHVATFLSASETHNTKNVNRTVRESLASVEEVIGVARDDGIEVRSYISTVFGCPYEGDVPVENTLRIIERLMAAGAQRISLGDTTGMANPRQVREVIARVVAEGLPVESIAVHMHDTRGTALANALAAYELGVRQVDGSVGGMGGCPYAPGASGNAASEDMVFTFEAMGIDTGIDLEALAEAGCYAETLLGRELPGRFHLYWKGAHARAAKARTA